MNKEEFLREIEKALDTISEDERKEILYDYEEHFMIGKENGKTEEEICTELGDPMEIAKNYLSNHANENMEHSADEKINNSTSISKDYNRRNLFVIFAIAAVIVICTFISFTAAPKHNNSGINVNGDGISIGGFRIDSSGIHGNGISIDNDGVKVPGVSIDDNGVKAPGVRVDDNGVKVPGVTIDKNGVKVPGVSVGDDGIKVDLPNINSESK